jgi:hypothetical protein
MTFARSIIVAAALALVAGTACAQFVKGNEAIKVMADGAKKVETPPTAGALLTKPCPAVNPACSGGAWKMVETPSGLMECTEVYARPTTCRASTYGAEKRSRVWVVKAGGDWKHCTLPELSKGCVSIKSLPTAAVQ